MGILNIRPAKRAGSKVVIGIAGISGSGKTYTALKLARGMVDHPSEIGFLDTENKRGSLYADILDGPFMIGDLYPPFSPRRYATAIKEFQDSGVKVLVIDSVTHEWEGEGGCDDIAHMGNGKMANWKLAKSEHKKFMNTLLQSDMHIICCVRAREKMDFSNPSKPITLGIQPVCEKNFMFEMTASMAMTNEGRSQEFTKMPEALRKAFGDGNNYIGEDTGRQLVAWVDAGDQTDIDLAPYQSAMQMACSDGVSALVAEYKKMPADIQERMKPFMSQYKASALEYDEQMKAEITHNSSASDLNQSIGEPPVATPETQPKQNKDI